MAVDRSGTSTNNNVYMLASVRPFSAGDGADVMFVRSSNGGQSFSAHVRINDDPVNQSKWHWFGTLSVAPNGRIDVVWLDSRNAANDTASQLFYSYSTNGGNTWSPNVAVSQPSIHSSVIRIRIKWAITLLWYPTTPEEVSPSALPLTRKRTFIMFVLLRQMVRPLRRQLRRPRPQRPLCQLSRQLQLRPPRLLQPQPRPLRRLQPLVRQ